MTSLVWSLVPNPAITLLMLGRFIFVLSGLSYYTSDEDFENMFSRFGRVEEGIFVGDCNLSCTILKILILI